MKILHPAKVFAFPVLALAALAPNSVSSAQSWSSEANFANLCSFVYSIVDLDQPPKPIRQTGPVYPAELKAAKIAGEALICLVVDASGQTRDQHCLSKTDARFGDAALTAVQQWVFKPAVKDGLVVSCRLEVPVVFTCSH